MTINPKLIKDMIKKYTKGFYAVVASLSMLFAAGCGDSPESVAEEYMDALLSGDLAAANAVSTESAQKINGFAIAMIQEQKQKGKNIPEEPVVDKVEVNGDSAKVTFEGSKDALDLVKVDGEWKVDVKKR